MNNPLSPRKILIAEDSSVIQNLTRKVLELQNYTISFARNGEQALELIQEENYDCLLLDINMPVMDGMKCARKIRQLTDPQKKSIPIVAITGNAKNYSIEDFRSAGFNLYLSKPLNFDKLVDSVNKLIASRRPPRA